MNPAWFWFSGWYPAGGKLVRRYSRGPMRLTLGQAEEEYVDTQEALFGAQIMLHRWDNSLGWQLIR